jgi:hypothetical protein
MSDRELMKQALEALKKCRYRSLADEIVDPAITALRERLEQPLRTHWEGCEEVHPECKQLEQEPVAWLYRDAWGTMKLSQVTPPPVGAFPVYTAPPQHKPLTDEEMKKIWYAMQNIMGWYSFQEIARAIEAAHGIGEKPDAA